MNSNTLLTADKFVINNERIKSIYKSNGKSYNPYNVWPLVGGMGLRQRHFTSFRVTYLVNRWLLLRAFQIWCEMGDDADGADGGPIDRAEKRLHMRHLRPQSAGKSRLKQQIPNVKSITER